MNENSHIKRITTENLSWINIDRPGKKETKWLENNFKDIHEFDLKDCLPPTQRPKVMDHGDYVFVILQFPVYNRKTREIQSSEVDLFIFRHTLITVHSGNLEPLNKLYQKYQSKPKGENNLSYHYDVSNLLYEILKDLLHYCFPMLNHISLDIDKIESTIFKVNDKNLTAIKEILLIKRNIVNFRKIMQAHKSVIQKLIQTSAKLFPSTHLQEYFNNLVNHTKDIWDFLEIYKDTINALHETHESLATRHLNDIIRTLTIFSVIVFPLTLLAAIFGMNTTNSMPFMNSKYNFWIIIGIMVLGTLVMFSYFKKKKWL